MPLLFLLFCLQSRAQIANYISNGSFEDYYSCTWPNDLTKAKYWMGIDSASSAVGYYSSCPGFNLVPSNGFTYQNPRSGIAYGLSTMYFLGSTAQIGYYKNRLKRNLEAGKTYCVKFYVNISNNSTYGIDGLGIYFGGSTVDTITKCNIPLTYINPQVHNPAHNIITDTLNWTLITGTFVANGTEKYALIGNFKSNASLDTMFFNPTNSPLKFTDVCIDDVSCIPLDLPAFAGNDTLCISNNSVYIGRPRDVGIDEACTWYKLPVIITPTTPALDTAAGIWVNPAETSTYVVRQEICGNVKWDTVVVYKDWTGIVGQSLLKDQLKMYPNPANDLLSFKYDEANENEILEFSIVNHLGKVLQEEDLIFRHKIANIGLHELQEGIYEVRIRRNNGNTTFEKLVILK